MIAWPHLSLPCRPFWLSLLSSTTRPRKLGYWQPAVLQNCFASSTQTHLTMKISWRWELVLLLESYCIILTQKWYWGIIQIHTLAYALGGHLEFTGCLPEVQFTCYQYWCLPNRWYSHSLWLSYRGLRSRVPCHFAPVSTSWSAWPLPRPSTCAYPWTHRTS